MIELYGGICATFREDMVQLFEGKDPEHKEITFLGITNHSIRRYLLTEGKTIADLDPEWCRDILATCY